MEDIVIIKLIARVACGDRLQCWDYKILYNSEAFDSFRYFIIVPSGMFCFIHVLQHLISFPIVENDEFHGNDIIFLYKDPVVDEEGVSYLETYIKGMKLFDKLQLKNIENNSFNKMSK